VDEDLDIPQAAPRGGLSSSYRTQRRGGGMDPGTRRLAIIAGGIGVALVAIIGVWSLSGSRSGTVPVIQAEKGPIRVKPENPGGMQVMGLNEDITADSSAGGKEKLAPAPEAPDPQALKAQMQAAAQQAAKVSSAPAKPAQVAKATPAQPVSLETPSQPATPPVSGLPQTKPETTSRAANPAPAAETKNVGRGTQVQLAALSSERAAMTAWEHLSKQMPELLSGRQPHVMRAEVDGRTYWRLRTGGFASIAQATQFCERVRAKGSGCSIASF
jgi:hypothetical protein